MRYFIGKGITALDIYLGSFIQEFKSFKQLFNNSPSEGEGHIHTATYNLRTWYIAEVTKTALHKTKGHKKGD